MLLISVRVLFCNFLMVSSRCLFSKCCNNNIHLPGTALCWVRKEEVPKELPAASEDSRTARVSEQSGLQAGMGSHYEGSEPHA